MISARRKLSTVAISHTVLPVARRTGLADPRAGGSPLPSSKLIGEPGVILRASIPLRVPSVVDPLKPQGDKPAGFFEKTFERHNPTPGLSLMDRRQQRALSEEKDRQNRRLAGPILKLNSSKRTAMDFARTPRVKPNAPVLQEGMAASTREPGLRGVIAQQQQVPKSVLQRLAQGGMIVDEFAPQPTTLPIGNGLDPISLAPDTPADERQLSAAKKSNESAFDWTYLLVAGAVVFLVIKAAKP